MFGGAATTSNSRGAIAYAYTASGGITFGGTASPPQYNKKYIASGGIVLGGGKADIVADVAQVRFDILSALHSDCLVSFDIDSAVTTEHDPLTAEFDVYEAANGLDAQFDIFSEKLKTARLSTDVQRPVADVKFHI